MRFYHNKHTNITAEEQWVADYLYQSGQVESREEAVEELQSRREFCGWYECEVSNTIEETMIYGRSNY
jgi:hypothetical protein